MRTPSRSRSSRRQVDRVLGEQPDRGVVLASVPAPLGDQRLTVRAGLEHPELIEQRGGEALRAERRSSGDRGDQVQQCLGGDLRVEHLAGQVLVGEHVSRHQIQTGGRHHDERRRHVERCAGAERGLPERVETLVAGELAGQHGGLGGVGAATLGELVDDRAQLRRRGGGDRLDGFGERGRLEAAGLDGAQLGEEAHA